MIQTHFTISAHLSNNAFPDNNQEYNGDTQVRIRVAHDSTEQVPGIRQVPEGKICGVAEGELEFQNQCARLLQFVPGYLSRIKLSQ